MPVNFGSGPMTYLVRIPDPAGAFTDGHWEGTITSSVFVVTVNSTTGTRHYFATAAMEFTVENGAVTSGSYGVSYFINFVNETGATGEGTSTVTGRFTGCGFAPQLRGTGFGMDAVLHIPDVKTPRSYSMRRSIRHRSARRCGSSIP